MKHEIFKLFNVGAANISTPEVEAFLQEDINPKSISIIYKQDGTAVLSIGYTKEKTSHHFHLVSRTLHGTLEKNHHSLEKEIKESAQKIGGVVCQDIDVLNNKVVVTFLTTK